MTHLRLFIIATVVAIAILSGCSKRATPTGTIVFCAASLSEVIEEIAATDDLTISLQSGGSSVLLESFLAGAPADILLLADGDLLERLEGREMETAIFASNHLVLVRPSGAETEVSALDDPKTVIAVADPSTAPLGVYTQQALPETASRAERVLLKDASAVRAAVRLAHTDLGVIYRSDLLQSDDLEAVHHFDPHSHERVEYWVVMPLPATPETESFFLALTSQTGQQALESAGFVPVSKL